MSDVQTKLAALRAKQEEATKAAQLKADEARKAREEREAKAAARLAAEEALVTAALTAIEAGQPVEISSYAALPQVKDVISETGIKTYLDRWATENELESASFMAGKARTGKWNGRFDRSAVLYNLGLEAVGAAPATFNQNLYRLKAGEVPGDPRPKAEQTAEWNLHNAVVGAIPAKAWEAVIKAVDAAYAAGEKALASATSEEKEAA